MFKLNNIFFKIIFLLSILQLNLKGFEVQPVFFAGAFSGIYEILGMKITPDSLKYKFNNNVKYNEELNNTMKDVYLNCLLNPTVNALFEELYKTTNKNTEYDIKNMSNIFGLYFKLFSRLIENSPKLYKFFKKKYNIINKKIIVFCAIYGFLNSGINWKLNKSIDNWAKNDPSKKTIKKTAGKIAFYGFRNFILNKFFNLLVSMTAILNSDDMSEVEKNLEDAENCNKNFYNLFEILFLTKDVCY